MLKTMERPGYKAIADDETITSRKGVIFCLQLCEYVLVSVFVLLQSLDEGTIVFRILFHFVSNQLHQSGCSALRRVHHVSQLTVLAGGDEVSLKELGTEIENMVPYGCSQIYCAFNDCLVLWCSWMCEFTLNEIITRSISPFKTGECLLPKFREGGYESKEVIPYLECQFLPPPPPPPHKN